MTGDAAMLNDLSRLRNDHVFVPNEVRNFKELTAISSRKGLDRAIVSGGQIVNIVSNSNGHLPNQTFFTQVENMLLEADIQTATRSINRENRSFAVDHILNDPSLAIIIKNGDDELLPMLRFTNSYDGTCRKTRSFRYFWRICSNGLFAAQSQIRFSIKQNRSGGKE